MIARREILKTMALTGAAGLIGRPDSVAAEPPPETTRIRLPKPLLESACVAPLWVGEELLRAEGFSDVQYVERGYVRTYDYAVQALREIPYNRWREYDSADTVRFFALRLHEAGMVKTNPQKLVAQGTDWRFVDELKKELKG